MPGPYFSVIVLTFNEELHLGRLLTSLKPLGSPVFILDSGSTDGTLAIANEYGTVVMSHAFENHPKQWDYALQCFEIKTPWVICLDADQVVTPQLAELLADFKPEQFNDIDGIYFNRKNYFKGKWISHGGYFPFYLLKMFRYGAGFSDLNENMDHRFIVKGKTVIWKNGWLIEENLKENQIAFWIEKHNRYSDLVAVEEIERLRELRMQTLKANFRGNPDERRAYLKKLWWKLPRYVRPGLYFIHRYFLKLGFLDGKQGAIFHFLQAFWFRLIVDIKMDELIENDKNTET